jgi:hypothetical protein
MKLLNPLPLSAIATLLALMATPVQALAQQPSTPDAKPSLNCLSGYPQTPDQGKQPVSRYQFATGLETCLNEVTQPLQPGNFATKTDLEQLTQRQQELNQELRQLGDRVGTFDSNPSAR